MNLAFPVRLCLSRRLSTCIKTSVLMTAIFLLVRFTRFDLFLHGDADHIDKAKLQKQDTFATHFQTGFHFQNNNRNSKADEVQSSRSVAPPAGILRPFPTPPSNKTLHRPNDWPEFFQPRGEAQFSLAYPYLHRASRGCGPGVKKLVMILSLPQNRAQRQAIRDTWGSVARRRAWPKSELTQEAFRLGLVFLLGEQRSSQPGVAEALKEESAKYGDIIQWEGLHDTYFNLTMKVLLGLQWALENCTLASHVIKGDDDTFVHVPRLHELLSKNSIANTIWGPYFSFSVCERTGKYAVSKQAYPFNSYGPHVKGNLYVISGDLVRRLVGVAPYLPYNNMEDVHVTGTLARTVGAHLVGFSRKAFSVQPISPAPCLFQDNLAALGSQAVSPKLHYKLWSILSGNVSCQG